MPSAAVPSVDIEDANMHAQGAAEMSGIIVGVDGSADSHRALEWTMNEAAIRRAPLTVITVVQPVVGN
jgi:nucleotide-binding universal stress UspA family protein